MEASGAERQRDQQKQGDGSEEKDEARRQEEQDERGEQDQRDEARAKEEQDERGEQDQKDEARAQEEQDEQAESRDEEEDDGEEPESDSDEEEDSGPFIRLKRLNWGEFMGMLAALGLFATLHLPWFSTSAKNENSIITSAGVGPGETATAWQTFPILKWLLVAACAAPFVLTWIVARGHSLSWKPGEVTMIVGMIAVALILLNGIILGKPGDTVDMKFEIGWLVGLIGAILLMVAGVLRQALSADARTPPGVM